MATKVLSASATVGTCSYLWNRGKGRTNKGTTSRCICQISEADFVGRCLGKYERVCMCMSESGSYFLSFLVGNAKVSVESY